MLQIGNAIFGGRLIIVAIKDNYRTFVVQSAEAGDPTGPFEIKFDGQRVEDDISRILLGD